MSEAPKLYTSKSKKARLKQSLEKQQHKPMESSSSSPSLASAAPKVGNQFSSTPPPLPPKESFVRRYKFLWPFLLTASLSVGAYLYMKTKKKDISPEEEIKADVPPVTISTPVAVSSPVTEDSIPPPPAPVKILKPIPEDHQRQLFKWILEEKRKVKAKSPEEKKQIDEEKAILKQFIRAKSIPTI